MANTWKDPIILDTANDDVTYTAANDEAVGDHTGVKYSTRSFKVKKILVYGANTDDFELVQCSTSSLAGTSILIGKLETGELNKSYDFPGGFWVNGILPKTVDSGIKIYIYVE